ncbi:hypothetical protein D3C77_571000 [compost metagenome]
MVVALPGDVSRTRPGGRQLVGMLVSSWSHSYHSKIGMAPPVAVIVKVSIGVLTATSGRAVPLAGERVGAALAWPHSSSETSIRPSNAMLRAMR